jgi:hypothetical protein
MKSQKEQSAIQHNITGLDLIGAKFQTTQTGSFITGLDLIGAKHSPMGSSNITGLDLIGA